MSDNIPALDFRILEYRVTISISALLHLETHELLLNGIIAVNPMDHILHLDSISSYILNSRSADLSRDIRQILHSPKAFLGSPGT